MNSGSTDYVGTIFALSSGALPSGVAVVRMSGPGTRFGLETMAAPLPEPRRAVLRSIRSRDDLTIDRGLVVFFPAPASFTGEDCAELHLHGGRAVVSAVLETLRTLTGFRHAEAGEFTRRAFENGRIDLTEAEGLADLIAAQTEMQRRLALEHSRGGATALYADWAERLTRERALIEAGLDFSDEGDVPDDVGAGIRARLSSLSEDIAHSLEGVGAGEIVRNGYRVVIAGAPNSGKSTLMNALACRDVSIVSDEPGTTRDVVTVTLDISGYVVILEDTAGLRETEGTIEREGIRRARQAMEGADLVLHLHDLTLTEPGQTGTVPAGECLRIGTKADCAASTSGAAFDLKLSAHTGAGLEALISTLAQRTAAAAGGGDMLALRARHRGHLQQCLAHVDTVVAHPHLASELIAEELRAAGECLGRITGRVGTEDLLDVIFGEFCIGK